MIQPGDLDTRLVLEATVEQPDGQGGIQRDFATVVTLWANVVAAQSSEQVVADASGAIVTHHITIRGNFDITRRHRFRLGERIFDVVSVRDRDRGRYCDVLVHERLD